MKAVADRAIEEVGRGGREPHKLPAGWSVQTVHEASGQQLGAVVIFDGHTQPVAAIPIDRRGDIPRNLAILRLLDVEEGSRDGRTRSPWVDLAIQAKHVARGADAKRTTERDRIAQYLWWAYVY